MDTRTDEALVDRIRDGDREAMGTLYDRYADRIYRFIYYKTFTREVAEDLTGDVFHKMLTRVSSFDHTRGTFSQWIYRIARNTVIDHYRTRATTTPIEDAFDVGGDDPRFRELDIMRTMEQVRPFLEALSPREREIIMLRVWEEYSYREIAAVIGGSEDAAKMSFSRAMKKLRETCGPLSPLSLVLLALMPLPFRELS